MRAKRPSRRKERTAERTASDEAWQSSPTPSPVPTSGDFRGATSTSPPGVYTDDLNRAEESLEKLTEYEFDVGLVYHGSSVLDGASETLAEYIY
jgi:hypothetical protein